MIDPEQAREARRLARCDRTSGSAATGAPVEIGARPGSCALTPERCRRWLARHRSDRHTIARIAADERLPAALIEAGIARARRIEQQHDERFALESRPSTHWLARL